MSATHASFGRLRTKPRLSKFSATGRRCDESVVILYFRLDLARRPSSRMIRATVFTQQVTPPRFRATCTRGLP